LAFVFAPPPLHSEIDIMTNPVIVALAVYALGAVISFATALLIKAIYAAVRLGKREGAE
jgi:hypothetical protein